MRREVEKYFPLNTKSYNAFNFTIDNLQDLTYIGYCFYETLRIDPPAKYSPMVPLKDVVIGGVTIKKGQQVYVLYNTTL
jgi:cytochrome P450